MRSLAALGLLALALGGCLGGPPAPLAGYSGEACDEVALLLPAAQGQAEAALPAGFRPVDARVANASWPAGRGLAVVAVNVCRFRAGDADATEPEAFVWLPAIPPANLSLAPNASQAVELAAWRPAGAVEAPLARAIPTLRVAAFEGAGFAPGAPFNATIAASGGSLRLAGTAARADNVERHAAQPCCRTFSAGPAGLVVRDFSSTDQPFGMAQCSLRTDLPLLTGLLGAADAEGPCQHNAGYRFDAAIRGP